MNITVFLQMACTQGGGVETQDSRLKTFHNLLTLEV